MAKKEKEVKKNTPLEKNPNGRPSKFTEELANKICRAIATSTDGLRKMCAKNPDFPCTDTLMQWRFDYPSFSEQYADAKRIQAELLVEEILEISDEGTNDYIEDENGMRRLNTENIQRSRLRVDTRKWHASKLLPKVYGDKNEVKVTNVEDEELHATVTELKNAVDLLKKHERDY